MIDLFITAGYIVMYFGFCIMLLWIIYVAIKFSAIGKWWDERKPKPIKKVSKYLSLVFGIQERQWEEEKSEREMDYIKWRYRAIRQNPNAGGDYDQTRS